MVKGVVFLDRDKTLVKAYEGRPANTVEEIELLPGVPEGMRELKQTGLRTVVISNQAGISLGYMSVDTMIAMNERLNVLLVAAKAPPIDAFYWCAHAPREGCECRKPRPGMFIRAQEDLHIDLGASYMVGDDVRDMECKVTAGLKYGIMVVSDRYNDTPHADSIVPSFQDAARIIKQLEGQV